MPAERAPMRKIREALRLKHTLGLSERLIAVSVGVSRSTVAEYLRRARVVSITWPVPEGMDDAELERRLFTPPSFEAKPARGDTANRPSIQGACRPHGKYSRTRE